MLLSYMVLVSGFSPFCWNFDVCPVDPFRCVQELSKDIEPLVRETTPFTSRRALFASIFMYSFYDPSRYLSGSHIFSFEFISNNQIG